MKTNEFEQPFTSFSQSMEYLKRFTNYERMRTFTHSRDALDLDRIRVVLDKLGNPHEKVPIFHVAGTKGKGSTCAILSSLLQSAGYRVGVFSQPHLISIHERLVIDGKPISDEDWVNCLNKLLPNLEAMRNADMPLTFFDIITIMSILYFEERGVDFMILEVGLGGRLDSTNVVTPIVSIITSIDYDHTHILGDSLEVIAAEKAGIIKEGIPVISGESQSGPSEVIAKIANEKNAALHVGIEPIESPINLHGIHQRQNAAVAVKAIAVAAELGLVTVDQSQIERGLMNVKLRARFEILHEDPLLILDGAHNPSSMRALRETIKSEFPEHKIHLLLGMTEDKEIVKSLDEILPIAHRVIFTNTGFQKSADPKELAQLAQSIKGISGLQIAVEAEIESAYRMLLDGLSPDQIGCITGSFYLAGEVAKHYD